MRQSLGNKLYYSIGEVAELTDLQPYTLRSWEKEFTCLRPRRVRGKNRAYRQRDIGIILLIKRLLYEERYSTRGVQQKLKGEPELVRAAAEQVAIERGGPDAAAETAMLAAAEGEAGPGPAPPPGVAPGGGVGSGEVAPAAVRAALAEIREDLIRVLKVLS